MLNYIKFCKIMMDKYSKQYPQIDINIVADIVDVTLNRAPDSYFTWEQIQNHPEFCSKCGGCCKTLDCEHFNGKTCDMYETRYDACKEYPFYKIYKESGLILDPTCDFAINLAEKILDKEFEKNIKLLTAD